MPLKATWKTFSPSYLSPFTSLSRVTLKPNFSHDDIIFSLSLYRQDGFSIVNLLSLTANSCGISWSHLLRLLTRKLHPKTWV